MDTLTMQDNGEPITETTETTAVFDDSTVQLVNPNQMLLNLKIAKNNNRETNESKMNNDDQKAPSSIESSGSTVSAPEIESFTNEDDPSTAGDSSNISVSPLGKLRHYKKELIYNAFLRHNANETITSEDESDIASSTLKDMNSNNSNHNRFDIFNTNLFNPSKTEFNWNGSQQALNEEKNNMLKQAEILLKLQEKALVKSPEPDDSIGTMAAAIDGSYLMASSNSSATFSPPPGALPDMPQMTTHVGRKPLNGPPCSLKILVDDNILEPMNGSLTYEIMGSRFVGDLLANGFIRMSGTNQVFANPSSWANYCRTTIPACNSKDAKQFGSAWSIIRYLGKRLDSYKLRWYRKQKKAYSGGGSCGGGNGSAGSLMGNISTSSTSAFNNFGNDNFLQGNNGCSSSGGATSTPSAPSTTTAAVVVGGGNVVVVGGGASSGVGISGGGLGTFNNFTGQTLSSFSSPTMFSTPTNNNRSKQFDNNNMFNMSDVYTRNWNTFVPRDRLYKLDKASLGDEIINDPEVNKNIEAIDFGLLDLNNPPPNVRLRCVPFSEIACMQPFLVTISTNVLLLIDFHSHLITKKVCGYLAGTWNPRSQVIAICQAFPCRVKDAKGKRKFEIEVKRFLHANNMILVGWYHSHPATEPHPSVADIKQQIAFEKMMFENRNGLISYSPCIGLIASPRFSRVVNDDKGINGTKDIINEDKKKNSKDDTNEVEEMAKEEKKTKVEENIDETTKPIEQSSELKMSEKKRNKEKEKDKKEEEEVKDSNVSNNEDEKMEIDQQKIEDDEEATMDNDENKIIDTKEEKKKKEDDEKKSLSNEPLRNYDTLFQMFWVLPMMTSSPTVEIGRPMQLSYTVLQNDFLTQELLIDMKMLAIHYYDHPNFVDFNQPFEDSRLGTEWDKLQESLRLKLPRDLVDLNMIDTMQQQALQHFWRFLHQLLVMRRGAQS